MCTVSVWLWGLVGGINWNTADVDDIASQPLFSVASLSIFLVFYAVRFYQAGAVTTRRRLVMYSAAVTSLLTALALTSYNARTSDFGLAPAQSRRLNRPCAVAGVYDWHDVWHLTSALALLGWSVTLLLAEDGTLITR